MSRVPGQKHFYCSPASLDSHAWIIWESRCKSRNIDGSWLYRVASRHYAYKLARLLNKIYSIDYTLLDIVRAALSPCYVKDYEQGLRMCEALIRRFGGSKCVSL